MHSHFKSNCELSKLTLIFGKGMLTGKKSACNWKSYRRCGFDPWAGKISVEEEMTTCSSIIAWEITLTEEAGRLQSMGLQKSQTRLSTHAHQDK